MPDGLGDWNEHADGADQQVGSDVAQASTVDIDWFRAIRRASQDGHKALLWPASEMRRLCAIGLTLLVMLVAMGPYFPVSSASHALNRNASMLTSRAEQGLQRSPWRRRIHKEARKRGGEWLSKLNLDSGAFRLKKSSDRKA